MAAISARQITDGGEVVAQREVVVPPATNSRSMHRSLQLMPSIRAFQRGPEEVAISQGELITRKVVGELFFLTLALVLTVEAIVSGIFVTIAETLGSLQQLMSQHEFSFEMPQVNLEMPQVKVQMPEFKFEMPQVRIGKRTGPIIQEVD